MMKNWRWSEWMGGTVFLIVVCLSFNCKREDREAPSIALFSPADGFSIIAADHFEIGGIASDDRGLSSVTATLSEVGSDIVVQTGSTSVTGKDDQFYFDINAGDRYTPSGTYSLKVTVFDESQNYSSAFTQIQIQALPLQYFGAVWAGDQGAGNFGIYGLDTAGTVSAGPSGLSNLSDLLADNRNGQLIGVQSTPGWLRAWTFDGWDPLFQFDLPQGTGSATYAGVTMNQNRYFGALGVPDYVRSYRHDGSEVNGFQEALHPATAIWASNERVYAGLQGVVGLPMKLDAFDATTGALQATLPLSWPVEGVLSLNDAEILVWGNEASVGQLVVVDKSTMVAVETTVVGERMVAAATANGRAWILTDQGLYEYFATGGLLSAMLVGGTYSALSVDATLDRVFLGGQDFVELHTGAGALVQTFTGAYGLVKFIDTRYNK